MVAADVKRSDPTLARIEDDDTSTFNAATFEQDNVHTVYEAIALHFSDTRYKPWPLIPAFFASMPVGSIGADLGCGNGKYLAVESMLSSCDGGRLITLGMDRSANLIDVALTNFAQHGEKQQEEQQQRQQRRRRRVQEVAVGDAICSNYRTASFDFAISIATIHHLSTFQRRRQAVEEMIRIVRPARSANAVDDDDQRSSSYSLSRGSGRFLIVVWALEQRGESRRRFEDVEQSTDDQRSGGQDLLVPWILRNKRNVENDDGRKDEEAKRVYQRFYHVFKQGELEELVQSAAQRFTHIDVLHETGGWEKGNWYGIWRCVQRKGLNDDPKHIARSDEQTQR